MIQKAHSLGSKNLIYSRLFVCILLASFLISCTTNVKKHGYIPSETDLDTLIIGRDNKQSVEKKIGLPVTKGLEGSFYYIRSLFNSPGYKSAKLIDRTVVVVSFTKNGLLKNIETFGIENETVIRIDYRVTETELKNSNAIQQIFRSISGPSASSLGL